METIYGDGIEVREEEVTAYGSYGGSVRMKVKTVSVQRGYIWAIVEEAILKHQEQLLARAKELGKAEELATILGATDALERLKE